MPLLKIEDAEELQWLRLCRAMDYKRSPAELKQAFSWRMIDELAEFVERVEDD